MADDNGQGNGPLKKEHGAKGEGNPLALKTPVNPAQVVLGAGPIRSPLVASNARWATTKPAQTNSSSAVALSPALQAGATPSLKLDAPLVPLMATEGAFPKKDEIAPIHGVNSKDDDGPPPSQVTALHSITFSMADEYEKRQRRKFWTAVLIVVVTAGGVMHFKPALAHKIFLKVAEIKVALENLGSHKKKAEGFQNTESENLGENKRGHRFAALTSGLEGCRPALSRAGVGKTPLASVDAAECLLIQDNLASAETLLSRHRDQIAMLSEAKINAQKADKTEADILLILIQLYLKEGRPAEADKLVQNRCRIWSRTNMCVGKLMIMADRRLTIAGEEGLRRMLASQNTLSKKATARMLLVAGLLEAQLGKSKTADSYFQQALRITPPASLALRKYIYETQAISLYQRGEMNRLQLVTSSGLKSLAGLDSGAKVKLKLLADLSAPEQSSSSLRTMLTRDEITYRARGDYELIEILGPEALRRRQESLYLQLLKRTQAQYGMRYRAAAGMMRKLSQWEIRATLGTEKYEAVLRLIDAYDKEFKDDQLSHHLRGIALLGLSSSVRQPALAAKEFRHALRESRNWESLYALGVSLIRSGKAEQVAPVISDMNRLCKSKGQRYWLDMLKSEWLIATGRGKQAVPGLEAWIDQKADIYTPRWLLLSLYKKSGLATEARQIEAGLEELASRVPFKTTKEAFASPIGVMALAPRPLE